MPKLKGHVQYDDWRGTAAADNADANALDAYLRKHQLKSDDEFLIGFEMFCGSSMGDHNPYFSARAFVVKAGDYDGAVKDAIAENPIRTRAIDLQLTLIEFFKFFKRFDMVLTHRGLDLEDREYLED